MKIRRDIASIPLRSAAETWREICNLIKSENSIDAGQLDTCSSAMADVIAENHPKDNPIVVTGCGPQLRIYLEYDQSALDRGESVDAISWCPTDCDDWAILVPSDVNDIDWLNKLFGERSPRISAYDKAKGISEVKEKSTTGTKSLEIDWSMAGES